MKKAIILMLVISLAICFSACTGGSGEISYTGEFVEDSSTTTTTAPADLSNSTSSTTAPTESNTSTTVLVPLTTIPGGTVPTVLTTEYTTEFSTVDYTPLDIPTTKPPVYTTYVNPTTNNYTPIPPQNQGGSNNTTTTKKEEPTTAKKTTYVDVYSGDTIVDVDAETGTLTLYVWADSFGIKMKKTSGSDAVVNINGEQQVTAKYSVSESVSDDGWITVKVEPKGNVAFVVDDVVTVTMPKGALLSTKSVSNKKFTSIIGSVS